MQVRALKTFVKNPYGLIRTGSVITVPDHLAQQWMRTRQPLVEKFSDPSVPPDNVPDRNVAHAAAPRRASRRAEVVQGNADAEVPKAPAQAESEPRPEGGRGRRSSSARQGRRSPEKT